MTVGMWVLVLYVLGAALACAGALVATWWVFVPGAVLVSAALALTWTEQWIHEREWRRTRGR